MFTLPVNEREGHSALSFPDCGAVARPSLFGVIGPDDEVGVAACVDTGSGDEDPATIDGDRKSPRKIGPEEVSALGVICTEQPRAGTDSDGNDPLVPDHDVASVAETLRCA